jgi:putative photosynthetic complex assembly protein
MATLHAPRAFNPMLLLAAAAVSSLLLVASVRWSGTPVPPQFDSPVTHSRALQFEDTASGAVAVHDVRSGAEVAVFQGEQGFLRGVLRAMARERKRQSSDRHAPLLLQNHADGSLSLFDASTGERINLESFGPTQRATFARLQDGAPAPSATPAQSHSDSNSK